MCRKKDHIRWPQWKSLVIGGIDELCVAVVKGTRILPTLIANIGNKTIKVLRGEELGHTLPLRNISQVELPQGIISNYRGTEVKEDNIVAPDVYKKRMTWLLRANQDILANSNKELGQTQTLRMKIDMGDHQLIKLRPYQTPIHKRVIMEEAEKDMLEVGVIEQSRSPWNFPIVIVEKKMVATDFELTFDS